MASGNQAAAAAAAALGGNGPKEASDCTTSFQDRNFPLSVQPMLPFALSQQQQQLYLQQRQQQQHQQQQQQQQQQLQNERQNKFRLSQMNISRDLLAQHQNVSNDYGANDPDDDVLLV